MRKIILNLAVSLDGFIAREDGRVDWLDNLDVSGSDLGFNEFINQCDTILMGRISYETTLKLGNGVWPFDSHKTYVFTSKNNVDKDSIKFTQVSHDILIKELLREEGKDIWLFGGGHFIQSMRDSNLIDEYILTTIPVLLGKGIRLFKDVDVENKLELIKYNKYNNIIQMHYKIIK